MHLAANMWVLWLFGNPVNRRIGNFYYVLSYLGTAVSLGVIYWFCGSRPLVGSSAVIFAILFLFMMLMPSATIRVGYLALAPLTLIVAPFQSAGGLDRLAGSLGKLPGRGPDRHGDRRARRARGHVLDRLELGDVGPSVGFAVRGRHRPCCCRSASPRGGSWRKAAFLT